MNIGWIFLIVFGGIIYFSIMIIPIYRANQRYKQLKQETYTKIDTIITQKKEINTIIFFSTLNKYKCLNRIDKISIKRKGIYILHNKSKNKYYVGQAHDLIKRVKSHFTGFGNGKIYHDYKNKDYFTIKLVPSNQLNKLEKETIWYLKQNHQKLYNDIKYDNYLK